MAKRILFLLNHAPYGSSHALEVVESILVAAVFEQEVSVLFKGDGLHQLLTGQDGGALGERTLEKVLRALPEYGVQQLFACRPSADRLGYAAGDFCLPVALLSYTEQAGLIERQDVVAS